MLLLTTSILTSCTNYQSFSSRKYLPKFKKASQPDTQIEAQQKTSNFFVKKTLSSNSNPTTDSLNEKFEPILLAELSSINKSNKIEIKKRHEWNNNWHYNRHQNKLPPETPEESIKKDKKKLSFLAKVLYIFLTLYTIFLTPLFIYLIEGNNTSRYKDSMKTLFAFLTICIIGFFALIIAFLRALVFGSSYTIFIFIGYTLLIAAIIYYLITLYLGIKTIIKN